MTETKPHLTITRSNGMPPATIDVPKGNLGPGYGIRVHDILKPLSGDPDVHIRFHDVNIGWPFLLALSDLIEKEPRWMRALADGDDACSETFRGHVALMSRALSGLFPLYVDEWMLGHCSTRAQLARETAWLASAIDEARRAQGWTKPIRLSFTVLDGTVRRELAERVADVIDPKLGLSLDVGGVPDDWKDRLQTRLARSYWTRIDNTVEPEWLDATARAGDVILTGDWNRYPVSGKGMDGRIRVAVPELESAIPDREAVVALLRPAIPDAPGLWSDSQNALWCVAAHADGMLAYWELGTADRPLEPVELPASQIVDRAPFTRRTLKEAA